VAHGLHVKSFQNVERNQPSQPLPVRGDLPYVHTAIASRNAESRPGFSVLRHQPSTRTQTYGSGKVEWCLARSSAVITPPICASTPTMASAIRPE
jgi:hypothetical protein